MKVKARCCRLFVLSLAIGLSVAVGAQTQAKPSCPFALRKSGPVTAGVRP